LSALGHYGSSTLTTQRQSYSSLAVLKAVVLGLEGHGKRGSWINPQNYLRSREETSGVFGQAFLSWLIHLINTGYRKDLALPDLHPPTSSSTYYQRSCIFALLELVVAFPCTGLAAACYDWTHALPASDHQSSLKFPKRAKNAE